MSFISIKSATPIISDTVFKTPIDFTIEEGQTWTVYGPNGSGKTLLAEVICGRHMHRGGSIEYGFMDEAGGRHEYPRKYIHMVGFQSTYGFSDFREAFYQQRFNSQEVDYYPTVEEILRRAGAGDDELAYVTGAMNLEKLLDRKLISLSSGQLRRLIIAKALLDKPRMMIFDNPYIGLDEETRGTLSQLFADLAASGVQLLFLIPALRDIPPCTTDVLWLDGMRQMYAGGIEGFRQLCAGEEEPEDRSYEFMESEVSPGEAGSGVVDISGIDISFGGHMVQSGLEWHIKQGEKWALLGPNGSGKSTLLSYIFADNPQAYRYRSSISLFGRRRGSGESIWDIKKKIGFTSSEMHLYYRENASCLAVVESGFFDSVGLFRKCSERQADAAMRLLGYFGLEDLAGRSFLKVSSGEQRLVLFARSIVKNPLLLILDEPFHGLDYKNKCLCMKLIDQYASESCKSLIFVTHYKEEIPPRVGHIKQLNP